MRSQTRFQFFALIWDSKNAEECDAAAVLTRVQCQDAAWQVSFSSRSVTVMCRGADACGVRAHLLPGNAGTVLGTVFRAKDEMQDGPDDPIAAFSISDTQSICRSKGMTLIDSYWGRYVAFLPDTNADETRVLRSPLGEIDCLTTRYRGVRIFFSSMLHCSALDLIRFTTNWSYVAASVCTPIYETRLTGLTEVERVIHGECWSMRGSECHRSFYWDPFTIAASRSISDSATAEILVRNTTRRCVRSWAGCYDRPLVMLSGGLDSSIVVSCLKEEARERRIVCLNYRNAHDLSTDEREFARLVASDSGCLLVEHESDMAFSLREALKVPLIETPASNIYLYAPDDMKTRLALTENLTGCLSGEGGDQVFFQNPAAVAARDYIRQKGLTRETFRFAMEMARIGGTTFWHVLSRSSSRRPHEAIRETFETKAAVTELAKRCALKSELFTHPWFEVSRPLPLGKVWHIFNICGGHGVDLYSPVPPDTVVQEITPLMSQPLVALVLQIPSYLMFAGGQERGLARRAFERDLPRQVVDRHAKAGIYDAARALLDSNRTFVREALLDGFLVREGILERPAIEEALSGGATAVQCHAGHLLEYTVAELWIRSWSNKKPLQARSANLFVLGSRFHKEVINYGS